MDEEEERTQHLDRCFGLASSLLKVGQDVQARFNKKRIPLNSLSTEGAVLCFLSTKGLTTAQAVFTLCRERYPIDALILVRTLFEAALWTLDIFREPDKAQEKATAFINYDPFDRAKKIRRILERHPQKDNVRKQLEEWLEATELDVDRIRTELNGRKDLLNYGRKKIEELADDVDLLYLYDTFYWESSLYAHNRVRSCKAFMSESEQGWDFRSGPREKELDHVLMLLCHFLWYLLKEFNAYFELEQDDVISEKWEELGQIFESALKLR